MLQRLTELLLGRDEAVDASVNNAVFYPTTDRDRMSEIFGYERTAAGVTVSPESAMRVSAVYACVRLLAGSMAQLPAPVYQRTGEARKKLEDDPLYRLLNVQPNPRWTAAAMWEYTMSSVSLVSDGYVWIRRKAGGRSRDVEELWPLNPRAVTAERRDNRLVYFFVENGERYGIDQDDMLHFSGYGFNGLHSMSVIEWGARNATGISIAADEHSGQFLQSGVSQRYVIKAPGRLTPGQRDNLSHEFMDRYYGTGNKKPLVLSEALDVTTLSMSARDAQLLEARRFQVEDIARAFGVPPFMIGATDKTTSWGSGIEQMGRGYLMFTLQPHLIRFQQEMNRKLFPPSASGKPDTRFVEFDTDSFLMADMAARFAAYRDAIGGSVGPGWMTADEVRGKENMAPLGGDAAKPYNPTPAPAPGGFEGEPE